ncbi:MAG: hypothetical protein WC223_06305 [Bacteroidales bacterium]
MEKLITELQKKGFLEIKIENEQEIFHLKTPCRFRIKSDIVGRLKKSYLSNEEIGGVLWAKPTNNDNENLFLVDKVSFVRNAIEDNKRADDLNKSNAYLPDIVQLNQELNVVLTHGYLPLRFHTHPTKGIDFIDSISSENIQTETSKQDIVASSISCNIGTKKLLMPRGLIVGNKISRQDIFIGLYNGFIAPNNFEIAKKKIQEENFEKITKLFSNINFTKGQKIGLAFGGAILLYSIIKYPKYSLPVIFCLAATLPKLLTNTQNIDKPNYFNKLSFGNADIYIPKV